MWEKKTEALKELQRSLIAQIDAADTVAEVEYLVRKAETYK
jgi:hypothetical protein